MQRDRPGVILLLTVAVLALSVTLWCEGDRQFGAFVGLGVPSILAAVNVWMTVVAPRT